MYRTTAISVEDYRTNTNASNIFLNGRILNDRMPKSMSFSAKGITNDFISVFIGLVATNVFSNAAASRQLRDIETQLKDIEAQLVRLQRIRTEAIISGYTFESLTGTASKAISERGEIDKLILTLLLEDKIDKRTAVKALYVPTFKWLGSGEFTKVDSLIESFLDKEFSLHMYVGLLTITFQYREKLSSTLINGIVDRARKQGLSEGYTLNEINSTLKGF